jgi:hypothetical protein
MQCMGAAHMASPAPARRRSARARPERASACADDAADAGWGAPSEGGNTADGGRAGCSARSMPARAGLSRLRAALGAPSPNPNPNPNPNPILNPNPYPNRNPGPAEAVLTLGRREAPSARASSVRYSADGDGSFVSRRTIESGPRRARTSWASPLRRARTGWASPPRRSPPRRSPPRRARTGWASPRHTGSQVPPALPALALALALTLA